MRKSTFFGFLAFVLAVLVLAVFVLPKDRAVTVYCAADDVHALPILQAFADRTGIAVHWQFDTEASKTVGLVQRLREEKSRPQCDVFWNNEPLHTIRLTNEGMFEAYRSPSATEIPAQFKDAGDRWTGFAGRARVLIVNTEALASAGQTVQNPTGMDDLADARWKSRVALAKPVAGTTLTHMIVLCQVLGRDRTSGWLASLVRNGCSFPSGNGPVATSVAEGQCAFGFTDTDDFRKSQADGKPVVRVFPDQQAGGVGTLVLPNTVALLKGSPEPELGRKLIDYLLSEEVEELLAASDGAHIPLRSTVKRPDHVQGPPQFRAMDVDWDAVVRNYDESLAAVRRSLGD